MTILQFMMPRAAAITRSKSTHFSTKDLVLRELRSHTGHDANPDSISAGGADLCCCCGRSSGVPTLVPVELRSHYVDGVGQFCRSCWQSFR